VIGWPQLQQQLNTSLRSVPLRLKQDWLISMATEAGCTPEEMQQMLDGEKEAPASARPRIKEALPRITHMFSMRGLPEDETMYDG
jgi:hypothetical protein